MTDLSHLRLEGTAIPVPYTFAGAGGGAEFRLPPRDRVPHAQRLKADLEQLQDDARAARLAQGLPDVGGGEMISVRSEQNFELKLDSLERRQSGIELISVKVEEGVTVAKVFVPRGKFIRLLALIDAYENRASAQTGQPRNRELIESIASIRLAALRDFWQDTLPFPTPGEDLWWEVWLRAGVGEEPAGVHARFAELARQRGVRVSDQFVMFPERVVTLAYGHDEQFSGSIGLLSLFAELRRAKELATDYRELAPRDQREMVEDLVHRLVPPPADAPSVCILDSGVNREHPLLAPALSVTDTQTINAAWGTADDQRQHGTEMAGIALYGSLTEVFPTAGPVRLRHCLESVKFLPPPPPGANDPKDYGPFTAEAIARAEIQAPQRNRAICMAVTADDRDLGMPSLWSGAVDQLCSGANDDSQRLMLISAGNLRDEILQPDYVLANAQMRPRPNV